MNLKINLRIFINLSLVLLMIGVVTGPAIYLRSPQLQIFRIALLFAILVLIVYLSRKTIKLNGSTILLLFYFSFYYFWTIVIGLIRGNIAFNDYINFTIMYCLSIILILFLSLDVKTFLKIIYKVTIIMIITMYLISIWEMITSHHLPISRINYSPSYISYVPTTFYTNPNDMMCVLSLMFYFLVGYLYFFKKRIPFFLYVLYSYAIFLSFITNARLSMLSLLLLFFIMIVKERNIFSWFLLLSLIFPLITFIKSSNFLDYLKFDYLLKGLTVGGESTSIRKYLYLDSLYSLEKYHGTGCGVNCSSLFFKSLNDPRLEGIINPHNYLLEIFINSGIPVFLFYFILNVYLAFLFLRNRYYYLIFLLFAYPVILLSSSSSLFIWYHYVFFISIIGFYEYARKCKKSK